MRWSMIVCMSQFEAVIRLVFELCDLGLKSDYSTSSNLDWILCWIYVILDLKPVTD